MGRIKTTLIKRVSTEIYDLNKDKITEDYETNKKILNEIIQIRSKKLRNAIAGYITRLKKEKEIV